MSDIRYRTVKLPDIVGKGYADFWHYKGRYRVVKGSRASKKSKTMALWTVYNIMKYPKSNMLIVRKTFSSLKASCFTEIEWAIDRLGVNRYWRLTINPLEATYIPTGQKIYFRGLDDPLKITSITTPTGILCWMWIEEAYEITKESDFDTLDETIRGIAPEGLFKQATLTLNPWNEKHWIKSRFFDREDPDTLAITTNYLCNEWLDEADHKLFEDMKTRNPRRYRVAGLGEWGIVDGVIFENWKEEPFTLEDIQQRYKLETTAGLDFGYTNDPTAFFIGFIDVDAKKLFVWDEIYERGLSNLKIYQAIERKGYAKEKIIADSAEPKSIDELRSLGLRATGAVKGRDSINHGIQYIQDLEIIVHPRCVSFITEISNYTWDRDKFGNALNRPIDDFNHLMDAMRYAVENYRRRGRLKTFSGGL